MVGRPDDETKNITIDILIYLLSKDYSARGDAIQAGGIRPLFVFLTVGIEPNVKSLLCETPPGATGADICI